ncbi:MAG: cellulase family glycosylhydrolase [Prevotella sp.]|nr:cellulase family glycosylhydrolase [Prevotella sp.]
MMKRICFVLLLFTAGLLWSAGQGVKPLPRLKVEGKWLMDTHGNHVVLHGVMDTPNMYFNGWRWGSPWDGSSTDYNAAGATKCKAYFDKIFAGLEAAKCNVFRLHLDPAWTNGPSEGYTWSGSSGQSADASGEADIRKFNPERLKTFLQSLYVPLMQKAMEHGMYVVVRPPGVCPGELKVGYYYQRYLLTVWDLVTQNSTVRKYAGQISIELANEPVSLKNAEGQDDASALHDYFQPIVDKMRANGYTGIIWAPGTGWQANYTSYATHPIEGYNIGYAVHDYCGWYGCSDSLDAAQDELDPEYSEDEIRLVRIKFLSEMAN